MSKRQFKSQASSSRVEPSTGFGSFGTVFAGSTLSYLSEPPNLSTITDANVVVAFKNLQKKDDITKAKGLEDLRSFVQSHPFEQEGGVEQPILEAWVKIYPRLSIDNSRRVRELSHILQFELLKSARKRMEKYIPTIVSAWLSGTYDRDRAVAKAANDGITSFLDTDEKVLTFWRRCQPQIIAYAQDAFKEAPQTLSDERNMSSDDMQAKYDRVIGASMSLIVNILIKLDDNDIQKQQEAYTDFLSKNKVLWGFIHNSDSFLRRITAQLLSICLDKQGQIVEEDLEIISYAFIHEALRSPQSNSSLQLLQALNKLTQKFPTVWSTAYKGKKLPSSRLSQFIEKGSQGGSSEYWEALALLFKQLPTIILPKDLGGAVDLLKAYRRGISSREEARLNAPAAWASYLETVQRLKLNLSGTNGSEELLSASIFPIFEQYLRPNPEQNSWSTGNNVPYLSKAFELCYFSVSGQRNTSLEKEWRRLTEILITDMLTSLPEQSKDYEKSQTTVLAEAQRWLALQAEIIKPRSNSDSVDELTQFLAVPCTSILTRALETISIRQGKPYGVAGILDTLLRLTPKLIRTVTSTQERIASFLRDEFPKLLVSPSSDHLIASMFAFGRFPYQEDLVNGIWQTAVHTLVDAPGTPQTTKAISSLLSNQEIGPKAQKDVLLQEYLFNYISKVTKDQSDVWNVYDSAITFDCLSIETASSTMSLIIQSLGKCDSAIRALELVCRKRPQMLRIEAGTYLAVMTNLLLLLESPDASVLSRAAALKIMVEKADLAASGSDQSSSPILEIIRDNLENAGPLSLSIETLAQQAESILNSQSESLFLLVLPDSIQWSGALLPILERVPSSELSLITPLGATISLMQSRTSEAAIQPSRDSNGFSIAFRMALYTVLLLDKKAEENFPTVDAITILRFLVISFSVANDQLSLEEEKGLWIQTADSQVNGQVLDFVESESDILRLISKGAKDWRNNAPESISAVVAHTLIQDLMEASNGTSPAAFYAARALHNLLSTLVVEHGWKSFGSDDWLSSLDVLKASTPNIFTAVAILTALQEFLVTSKFVTNLCNRLVSDITGASANGENTLRLLVLLNATLSVFESSNLPVVQNRIVFAIKHINSWMSEAPILSSPLVTQFCRSLQLFLPSIKDVYGPHWEMSIKFCIDQWSNEPVDQNSDGQLMIYNASLRLVTSLKNIADPNDDLSDALLELAKPISDGLINLLRISGTKNSPPWQVFQYHLWMHARDIPAKHITDPSVVYPLIASESIFVQAAAFSILGRVIPAAQEQISIDVILEKKDAKLPDELLSLLLDVPSYDNFSDEQLADFPSEIRGYVYSWQLVFSSYPKASYKVRNDYNEQLKSENYISPFLEFLFDVLGHSAGQPLNLDKGNFTSEQIRLYNNLSADMEGEERNLHWILVNLYYLCLKFTPSSAKSWWMNCKSKQTRMAVESWTEKYFSPIVIADALDEVATWASNQETESEEEKELIIKVSKNSREIYAGYEVDDMQMQIVIRLPAAYPLEGVKVEGINRVAVSEKKWQSWLMITQGVITFSNGSIIDGLTALHRNITGALKGQTECAICYSIISSDKKMPDKRCQTCKNLFHSSCLFKWFASSNQSTCPLCRNPFNYGSDVASRARRRGGPE